jgi:hypothetical protein
MDKNFLEEIKKKKILKKGRKFIRERLKKDFIVCNLLSQKFYRYLQFRF